MVSTEAIIAVSTFTVSLIFILFDWVDKTIVALTGAAILVITKVLTWNEALFSIDFETIILLFGLMLLVIISQYSGIFSWLNVKIAEKTGGNPLLVFIALLSITFIASTVLNNATVVLLIIPISIALARGLSLNTKLLVVLIAIFSNIGGTLTLIGDPPNTLIGVQVGLTFNDFVRNLSVPVLGSGAIVLLYIISTNWDSLKPNKNNLTKLFSTGLTVKRIKYQFAQFKPDKYFVATTLIVILATILCFIFQPNIGQPIGIIGLSAGVLMSILLCKKINFIKVLHEVEWDSLLFFMGLFVQVEALEKAGVLNLIAEYIASYNGSFISLLLLILWVIGLASTIINNIPFVALLIPVIIELQEKMSGNPHLDLLWWALSLGACLGGNGTIIGSSAGLLAVDSAKKCGINISFMEFIKISMPVTIISLGVSSIYLVIAASS